MLTLLSKLAMLTCVLNQINPIHAFKDRYFQIHWNTLLQAVLSLEVLCTNFCTNFSCLIGVLDTTPTNLS